MSVSMIERKSGERFLAQRTARWGQANATTPATLLDLAANELTQPAAPHIVEATINALEQGATHYTDRTGIPPLRAAVAERFGTLDDLSYQPQGEILICGGGHEALFVELQMLIEPGDEVLVAELAAKSYREGVLLAGGIPIAVETTLTDQFALQADAVREKITPRTRLLLFGSPAIPTGGVTTGADLEALATVVRDHNLLVIWDESYREWIFGEVEQANIAALPGMRDRTIIIGSFSARYAMGGWRAGYVVGPAAFVRPITLMKQALTICSPAPSQWAALAALRGPQGGAAASVREVAARRKVVCAALEDLGLPCGGEGSPFIWFTVDSLGVDAQQFVAAAREAGILLRAGTEYSERGTHWVRLTLNGTVGTLQAAMQRLATIVDHLRQAQ